MSGLHDVLPLSPLQEGMLFHALYDRAAVDVYTTQLVLDLDGELRTADLRRAVDALLRRHGALRACFRQRANGQPIQVIVRSVRTPWEEVDLVDRPDQLDALLAADRVREFDLAKAPLIRFTLVKLAERRHKLVVSNHHILLDGWSAPLLIDDLFSLYAGRERPEPRPYRDYLAWFGGAGPGRIGTGVAGGVGRSGPTHGGTWPAASRARRNCRSGCIWTCRRRRCRRRLGPVG